MYAPYGPYVASIAELLPAAGVGPAVGMIKGADPRAFLHHRNARRTATRGEDRLGTFRLMGRICCRRWAIGTAIAGRPASAEPVDAAGILAVARGVPGLPGDHAAHRWRAPELVLLPCRVASAHAPLPLSARTCLPIPSSRYCRPSVNCSLVVKAASCRATLSASALPGAQPAREASSAAKPMV